MLFLKTKNPVGRKRELGGSRFSCIYKRPQSELKSAPPNGGSASLEDTGGSLKCQ
jgi:hypothetical protein